MYQTCSYVELYNDIKIIETRIELERWTRKYYISSNKAPLPQPPTYSLLAPLGPITFLYIVYFTAGIQPHTNIHSSHMFP